ncbi:GNAT family N-acetyltransferase [Roseburia sp. MUC/MUC-530-WT-4D]|uniref:GNAT family N-acetyltransferase n=1 Tax=Roseburia porci TaxID=2605790 RepID=A0A6L5YV48_9FIRM|nr:GNAT family N-acetyltransferase [Roseburia porci]
MGYVLSKDYWGKGLMPEAVNRVIKLYPLSRTF